VTVQSTVDKVLTGTVPSGTANGVLFLNGSKVVSSGSALTFDGTNFNAPAAIVSGSIGMLYGNTFSAGNSQTWLTNNATASDTYRTADTAQRIRMLTGIGFAWETAASGSIGGAISWSEQMRLDSTGLGIGTSSPGAKLDVVTGTARWRITNDGSGNIVNEVLDSTGAVYRDYKLYGLNLISYIGGTEQMRLTSTGLGIGTSSPGTVLDVQKATGEMRLTSTTGTNAVWTRYSNTGGFMYVGAENSTGTTFGIGTAYAGVIYVNGANPLAFATSGAERMRLDSSGNLLVGTTSGNERLRVSATNNAAGFVNTTAASATAFSWNQATSGDNIFYDFGTEASFTGRGSITYNRAGGLVAYNTTSDYRAKDILGPVVNPGATIDALTVYEGQMKGATQGRPMLVAHEAQEHAPYAVSGVKDEVNEDGTPKYQQMDVSSLVPLLIAEIQSLRARVAALEA
jgi:hypothetical protein